MSARKELTIELYNALVEADLMTSPTAGDMGQEDGKGRPRYVTFGTARYMDGVLRVYGSGFIQFKVQGSPMNNGRYPSSYITRSKEAALAFIAAMGNGDREAALDATD